MDTMGRFLASLPPSLPAAERDTFLLNLITLVEANNDIGSVPFRLPQA